MFKCLKFSKLNNHFCKVIASSEYNLGMSISDRLNEHIDSTYNFYDLCKHRLCVCEKKNATIASYENVTFVTVY